MVDIGVGYLAPYESCGEDFKPVRPEHSEARKHHQKTMLGLPKKALENFVLCMKVN